MPNLDRILKADRPLSLTSVPRGAQPLVMADLARAAKGRAVFIAPDEQAMRAVTDAAQWFAPELQVIEFPAWDCLPYDRASPALSVASRRLAARSEERRVGKECRSRWSAVDEATRRGGLTGRGEWN